MINILISRLMMLGEVPLCNGIASRAPHFFGVCFILCYRCSAIIISFLMSLYIGYCRKHKFSWIVLLLCLIPMVIDGGLQTFFFIESTNLRRVVTGGLFGFGLGNMISLLFQMMDAKGTVIENQ